MNLPIADIKLEDAPKEDIREQIIKELKESTKIDEAYKNAFIAMAQNKKFTVIKLTEEEQDELLDYY